MGISDMGANVTGDSRCSGTAISNQAPVLRRACATDQGRSLQRPGRWYASSAALICVWALLLAAPPAFGQDDEAVQRKRVATLQQAADLIQNKELERAEAVLNAHLGANPDDPLALNLLGLVRLGEHNTAEAEKLFRKAIEVEPRLVGPYINLGLLYAAARPTDAITELSQAFKNAPHSQQALQVLRGIAKDAAVRAARTGKTEEALAVLLEARRAKPGDPEILYQLGMVEMSATAYDDARQVFEEALKSGPHPDATYGLARVYLALGQNPAAEEHMRKYLELRPNDATAHYGLGYILLLQEKLDEAEASFQKSLSLIPDQTESPYQLGLVAARRNQMDVAREHFERVLKRDPKHGGALTEMGVILFRSRDYSAALSHLEQAAVRAPSYHKAHHYLGLTLAKLGRKEEAEREFQISRDLQQNATTNKVRINAEPQ